MSKLLFPISLMLIAMLIVVGCGGDDDCPSCPTDVDTVTLTETVNDTLTITDTLNFDFRKLIVSGEAQLDGDEMSFWCEIYDADGRIPELDSLTLGGVRADNLQLYYDDGAVCYETEDEILDAGHSSGDEVEIIAYTAYCAGTCLLTMLDYNEDAFSFIDWAESSPYDTVAVDEEIVLDWNPVTSADWYAYRLYHYYDSSGSQYTRTENWVSDTTLTITSAVNGFDGYWEIYVYATSGPAPDEAGGNFTGCDAVSGRFTSSSRANTRIYVGTGDDSPPTLAKTYPVTDERTMLREILKNLQNR